MQTLDYASVMLLRVAQTNVAYHEVHNNPLILCLLFPGIENLPFPSTPIGYSSFLCFLVIKQGGAIEFEKNQNFLNCISLGMFI